MSCRAVSRIPSGNGCFFATPLAFRKSGGEEGPEEERSTYFATHSFNQVVLSLVWLCWSNTEAHRELLIDEKKTSNSDECR